MAMWRADVQAAAKSAWRHLILLGVLDVIAGILAVSWPDVTVLAAALIVGITLLVAGLIALAASIALGSGWTAVLAVLAVIGGVICLVHPGTGVVAILIGTAIWFLFLGAGYIALALTPGPDRFWWGLLGALSVVGAVAMLASPGVAIATAALLIGIALLVRGVSELTAGWSIRRIARGAQA